MDIDEKVTGMDGKSYPRSPEASQARYPLILEMHEAGLSLRAIAAEVGCSVNTVRRVIANH